MNNDKTSNLMEDTLANLGILKDYDFIQTETNNDRLTNWLDNNAGIDGFIKQKETDIVYSLASRIRNYTTKIYPEFTIRQEKYENHKSEYIKRLEAIKNGGLFPTFTIQSWYSGSVFVAGAMIKTKDLYSFITDYPIAVKHGYSDRDFIAVTWNNLQEISSSIMIVTSSLFNQLN